MANISETMVKPHVELEKMKGFTTDFKTPSFPNIPTFIKQGYDQVNMATSGVITGPKGLPLEIVEAWEKALSQFSKDPGFISSCEKIDEHIDLKLEMERLNTMMKEAVERYSRFTPEELGWAKAKK